MTAETGVGIGSPEAQNEKGARAGANLHGSTNTRRRLSILSEAVKREAGIDFMWKQGGMP